MKNLFEMVSEIRRRDKHSGHTGGLDGCPLCNRTETSAESVVDELLSFPAEEAPAEADPNTTRLKKIFGDT